MNDLNIKKVYTSIQKNNLSNSENLKLIGRYAIRNNNKYFIKKIIQGSHFVSEIELARYKILNFLKNNL